MNKVTKGLNIVSLLFRQEDVSQGSDEQLSPRLRAPPVRRPVLTPLYLEKEKEQHMKDTVSGRLIFVLCIIFSCTRKETYLFSRDDKEATVKEPQRRASAPSKRQ